ncbi:hypothetical protein A2U01_0052872, partial [Trifolium medium]|nr:hypothetical protein [Trifolium medium]
MSERVGGRRGGVGVAETAVGVEGGDVGGELGFTSGSLAGPESFDPKNLFGTNNSLEGVDSCLETLVRQVANKNKF